MFGPLNARATSVRRDLVAKSAEKSYALQECPICNRKDGFHRQKCVSGTVTIIAETYSSVINKMYFALKAIQDTRTIDRFAIADAMETAEDKLRMLRVFTDGFKGDTAQGDPDEVAETHRKGK